mmetsp:Transcript_22824/g.34758  ORF Transcript_22824/g.34758 Transcript_22824/m.34758 type:complete len:225 (-) Transcript_22824:745-1419(-)
MIRMPRRSPLKRCRWISLILLRWRLHRTQLLIFPWRGICEHDNSTRCFLRTDRSVPLVQVKGADRCLRSGDARRVGEAEGRRFWLAFFLRLGLIRLCFLTSAINIHAFRFVNLFLVLLFLVHVHGSIFNTLTRIGILLGPLPRQARLVLRRCRKLNRLHPLLLFLLLLFQLPGIRVRARLGIAHNLKLFGILEILVQSDSHRGRDGKAKHVHEGVPVPVLKPEH